MRQSLLAAAALVAGSAGAFAATPVQAPLNGAQSGNWLYFTLSDGFRYDVLLPYNYSTAYTYPVVMYLHGSGTASPANTPPWNAFPSMINSTSVNGVNYRADFPAIVVAPQCVDSSGWGGNGVSYSGGKLVEAPTSCGTDAISALETVLSRYSVNTNKVYLAGYSMGGIGTWYLYATNLNLFAAAIPVSGAIFGGVTPSNFQSVLGKAPLWAFHGYNDTTVSKSWDESMYRIDHKRLGGMKYIEFVVNGDSTNFPHWLENANGDGHANADTSAFQNKATLEWLFSKTK